MEEAANMILDGDCGEFGDQLEWTRNFEQVAIFCSLVHIHYGPVWFKLHDKSILPW
jgi:hypothetical protein